MSVFGVFILLQADGTARLDSHGVAVLAGTVLYLELFIFALVSLAGYFFKTFGKIRKGEDWQTMVRGVGIRDLWGLIVSIALGIVSLLIGRYLFNLGR
ncbi:hypothetical protein B0E51_04075 [Rhodanobacter sp. C05]|nr:hypothetical protein B0E51_04075 [Rhodanobacter sp. C05]